MKKNILAICSLILAFPLVGQAMQPFRILNHHYRNHEYYQYRIST